MERPRSIYSVKAYAVKGKEELRLKKMMIMVNFE